MPEVVELMDCPLDAHELDMLALDGAWEKHLLPWGEAWLEPDALVVVVEPAADSGYPPTDRKADWAYEEGPQGGDRWVNQETGDVRYREPADADHEPGEGNEVAKNLEEGDRIVVDGAEGEVETLSDMGGGHYVAIRDDQDEVHTARVGPNHEFEKPSDDGPPGGMSGVAFDRRAAEPGDEILMVTDGLDTDEPIRGKVLDTSADRRGNKVEVEWELPDGSTDVSEMRTSYLRDAEFAEGHEPEEPDPDEWADELGRGEELAPVWDVEQDDEVLFEDGSRMSVQNTYSSGRVKLRDDSFDYEETTIDELKEDAAGVVREAEIDPSDLEPDERKAAADLVARGATASPGGIVTSDWQAFGGVLDQMTDDELRESLEAAVLKSNEGFDGRVTRGKMGLRDFLGEGFELSDETAPNDMVDSRDLGPILSRMDGDEMVDAVNDLLDGLEAVRDNGEIDDRTHADIASNVMNAAALYTSDPGAREEILSREPPEEGFHGGWDDAVEMMQAEEYDDFKQSWIDGWHVRGGNDTAIMTQLVLDGFGPNEDGDSFAWTAGRPMGDVAIPDRLKENFENMYERTQEQLPDDTMEVHRGTNANITTHSNLESWSSQKGVAKEFDDFTMSAGVEPEEVLATWETLGDDWPEEDVKGKKEWMVLGGAF